MSRALLAAGVVLAAHLISGSAEAQQMFPALLEGHIVIPAKTVIAAPADAPADLKQAGKFTTPVRTEALGTVMGLSNGRPTGISLPIDGQPVQGHSGIKRMADGTYWVLTDNGFGSKFNSPDSMLYLNHWRLDFATGTAERQGTIFLRDPDKKVPFHIVEENTATRYLTGADFDIEGFQMIGDTLWVGEEFGPFLIKADMTGKVQAVYPTLADGKPVMGPDNPAVTTPGAPNQPVVFNLQRSKGFEGLASSKDGKFLYGLLEGPLWVDANKDFEKTADAKTALRILEWDVAAAKWTGRFWHYPLEAPGNSIGDFNMIDGTFGLVIERDNNEGTADKACPAGVTPAPTNCFAAPAALKRVYKIELTDATVGKSARKVGYIDLLAMQDPNKKAKVPLVDGVLKFPFVTIENVDVVDATHIIVGNDNNFPFSAGRLPNQQDDNEFVLLEVGGLLNAR